MGRKFALRKKFIFDCKCERCRAELLSDTFKYGISCARCRKGYCTFANRPCNCCAVEMGFEQWKAVNRKIEKIQEKLQNADKFV